VNVYVESNFVLELALLQEQHASCEEILRLSEAGSIHLVIPAYSIAEPYETLVRRHNQRKRMKADLDDELRQLARTTTYAQRLIGFHDLTVLLIDSADEEAKRLEEIRTRLLKAAEIIPLETLTLTDAIQHQRIHGLSPQDAIVYAAVLSHLQQHQTAQSCFLNRNSKDFDDPDLVEELNIHNCKLLARFDTGYQFILSHLSQDSESA
jgi:predicted nucleic acid-binding protein